MAILNIITAPNPLLNRKSEKVKIIDDKLLALMDDMLDTMYHFEGCGLAAVQVGVLKRVMVIDLTEATYGIELGTPANYSFPMKLINPELIHCSETKSSITEGCVSLPNQRIDVSRPDTITLKFMDETSKEHIIKCTGLFAKCIQHEIDHLEGKTLLNYVSNIKKNIILKKLQNYKKTKFNKLRQIIIR